MSFLVLMAAAAVVTLSEQVANPQYQFYKTSGDNFVHGYAFPPYQVQGEANVPGTVTYLNRNSHPAFLSHPMFGLGTYVQAPVVGHRSVPANVPVVQQQQYTSKSEQDLGRSSLSPLLKLAVDAGFVRASGSSQSGSPQYDVSPELADDAGSVSELAYRLGAIPVAAVHDVQMRPNNIIPDESFSPVLIHQDTPKVTMYTLEVPIQ